MNLRLHRRLLAKLMFAMMLFTQGVTAWSGCDWIEGSPDRAVLAAAEVAPCHDSGFGAACLAHCLSDRQTVQKVTAGIPAMPSTPVLRVAFTFDSAPAVGARQVSDRAFSTGPPRRILHQSLQI